MSKSHYFGMGVRESLLLTDMRPSFLAGEINLSLESSKDEGDILFLMVFVLFVLPHWNSLCFTIEIVLLRSSLEI